MQNVTRFFYRYGIDTILIFVIKTSYLYVIKTTYTMNRNSIYSLLLLVGLCGCAGNASTEYTRGIGEYPGKVEDYTGPEVVEGGEYRNLALNRAAWHSSSHDYNLTAHLATDGIIIDRIPYHIEVFTHKGPVEKRDSERIFDDNTTSITLEGGSAYLLLKLNGEGTDADMLKLSGTAVCDLDAAKGWNVNVMASYDGNAWDNLGSFKGNDFPGQERMMRNIGGGSQNVAVSSGLKNIKLTPEMKEMIRTMKSRRNFSYEVRIPDGKDYRQFRIDMEAPAVKSWNVAEMDFMNGDAEVSVLPSHEFSSAWMSRTAGAEWIYVDLGAEAEFDRINLHWISRPTGGSVETSDDAETWVKIAELSADEDDMAVKGKGRYVRLSLDGAADGRHIILSEMEVYGTGGVTLRAQEQAPAKDGKMYLAGGGWKIIRAPQEEADGKMLSTAGFDDQAWLPATVPGTVASSYYNAGAIADIRYDDDQLQISESWFYSDFWYRNEFEVPADFAGKTLMLNFDGINWKADVFVNGTQAGRIEGAFTRGRFDITDLVKAGEANALAVRIYRNDNPGIIKEQTRQYTDVNGGDLGADNPTFHATIGWDWIPTVRGRNIGIWNDVYLSSHDGGVTVDDVFFDTDLPLPETSYADIKPVITLTNHNDAETAGSIQVKYGPMSFSSEVTLAAGQTKDVTMAPVRFDNPELWWPNGYGAQHLYDVEVAFVADGKTSDVKKVRSGVREMSYTLEDGILDIFVNGRRLIGNGGNWGYPEIYNNYRAREYDIAVGYHADMNFTMIRNWVGMTGDEEFYEACDRHGVMVWQDFWLANPVDGPNPYDESMFVANAEDYLKRIRNHPSIGLYCGRNEGNPPQTLDGELARLVSEVHPGLYYIPHSASGPVSGYGPYRALPVNEYFGAERGRDRLHSERGMPNVMTYESMTRMLSEENRWPQNNVWGVHDYTLENAQSCATFNQMIETAFGEPSDLKEFTEWAQWINYNGYRAMYESRSWNRKGLIIWMSHSCWPSMVWQTYDYYFEPTAAYFGAKKASAPIRIQWNPVSGQVEVVNNNAMDQNGLKAEVMVLNYDGKTVYQTYAELDSKEDTTVPVCALSFDSPEIDEVYYIKLRLTQGDRILADNFYCLGKEDGNLRKLHSLPEIEIGSDVSMKKTGGEWLATVQLKNNTDVPALMIRLKVYGKKTGESILPAYYSDNYISLMPGEEKTVTISFKEEDTRGERPAVDISGFNLL